MPRRLESSPPPAGSHRALQFSYSSHLLEDLGVNLYTSLSKALVEFVANAYDADSPGILVTFDKQAVDLARKQCQIDFEKEKAASKKKKTDDILPLERRTLSPDVTIVLEDNSQGKILGYWPTSS
jgi:hypothetical protein